MNDKRKKVLSFIKDYYSDGTHFSAADLSKEFGEKIYGATLTSIYKDGYLMRYDTSPVTYSFLTDNINEAINNIEGIFTIKDVESWPLWKDYTLKDYFVSLGTIYPNKDKEMLDWEAIEEMLDQHEGLDYGFVIEEHLYKIGKTDTTMKDRLQSYNCGKKDFRKNGTCSVTNFKVLQTLLNIGKPVTVYALLAPKATLTIFGKTYEINTSPSKFIEGILIEQAKKDFGDKLPGCFQD